MSSVNTTPFDLGFTSCYGIVFYSLAFFDALQDILAKEKVHLLPFLRSAFMPYLYAWFSTFLARPIYSALGPQGIYPCIVVYGVILVYSAYVFFELSHGATEKEPLWNKLRTGRGIALACLVYFIFRNIPTGS